TQPGTLSHGDMRTGTQTPERHVSPVLRIFFMTDATCPFSIELSSLTMRMRHEQSTRRDRARRIRPTARSDRGTSTKRCL
ncbi:hypothetical protein NQD34_000139, partial [Periophthalmus magnuspinnatus]